jgi:hypothetical protein
VHHVQDAVPQRGPNNDHSVGAGSVVKVDCRWVGENGGRFREGNAVLLEVRPSLLVVPLEIAFNDGSHCMNQYGLRPIFGQALSLLSGPANVAGFSCEGRAERGLRQLQAGVGQPREGARRWPKQRGRRRREEEYASEDQTYRATQPNRGCEPVAND